MKDWVAKLDIGAQPLQVAKLIMRQRWFPLGTTELRVKIQPGPCSDLVLEFDGVAWPTQTVRFTHMETPTKGKGGSETDKWACARIRYACSPLPLQIDVDRGQVRVV